MFTLAAEHNEKSHWQTLLLLLLIHRAQLVLRCVTVCGFNSRCRTFILVCNQPPRPTQPSILPGLVNEDQLQLERQRQVRFIPLADEHRVCRQNCEIPWERVPHLSTLEVCSRQGAIQIHVYLHLTLLLFPYLLTYLLTYLLQWSAVRLHKEWTNLKAHWFDAADSSCERHAVSMTAQGVNKPQGTLVWCCWQQLWKTCCKYDCTRNEQTSRHIGLMLLTAAVKDMLSSTVTGHGRLLFLPASLWTQHTTTQVTKIVTLYMVPTNKMSIHATASVNQRCIQQMTTFKSFWAKGGSTHISLFLFSSLPTV